MKNEKNEDFEESNHSWRYDTETENNAFPLDVTVMDHKITIGTTTVNELREMGFTLEINQDTVEPSSKERINILGPS